jgi:hypothetical protein
MIFAIRLRRKLERFLRLPRADRWLLIRIALLVPLIETALRLAGFKRTCGLLRRFAGPWEFTPDPAGQVDRHGRLLELFYRHFPGAGRCLARSLSLWWLLQRIGVDTQLRVGMMKQDGGLIAHAWIEYGSHPLKMDHDVNSHYSAFSESIVVTAANL